jgi:phosphatidylinositol alpha-1,6-mannosyltransferase
MIATMFPPGVGGVKIHAAEIARFLLNRGHVLQIIAPESGGEDADKDSPLPVKRLLRRNPVQDFRLLREALLRFAPDAVYMNDPCCLPYLHLLKKRHTFRLVSRTVGNDIEGAWIWGLRHWTPLFMRRPLMLACLNSADGVTANSRYTERLLCRYRVPKQKICVISGGVDVQRFRPIAESAQLRIEKGYHPDDRIILTVARLVRFKGIDDVIQAVAKLKPDFPRLQYAIVGDGPQRKKLERLIRSFKAEHFVQLWGKVSPAQVPSFFQLCDIYVQSSKSIHHRSLLASYCVTESMGRVYCEAGACGKAVIAGRTGGVTDVVKDGVNGLLVNPGNVDEICQAITTLLTNPSLASQLGSRGLKMAHNMFSWEKVGAETERVITGAV